MVADDVGIDKVRAYGEHPDAPPTPTLDALAAEGVLFRNAYSQPMCSPTRAAYLTGRSARRTGIGWIIPTQRDEWMLQPEEITIPEMLDGASMRWATSLVGKWHLASRQHGDPAEDPGEQGFDWWAGSLANIGGRGKGFFAWNKNVNGEVHLETTYATTDTVDDALARIEAMPEPWFLLVSFNAAHVPLHVPPDDLHTREGLEKDSPEPDRYDAMVEAMDTELGRLLRDADPEVMARTTVMFLADNGTPGHAIRPPWDPQRSKGTLYEGGVNVPLIVTGPQVGRPGSESRALVHAVDVFATVADIAGVDLSTLGRPIDGVSFLDAIRDPDAPGTRDVVVVEKFKPNGPAPGPLVATMVRGERYKLVIERDGERRFYELEGGTGREGPNLLEHELSVDAAAALEALSARLR